MAKRLQFDHLVPVGIGGIVWAEATLDRIEGRRLVFTLSVSESAGLVAAGKLIRVIVDRDVVPVQRPLIQAEGVGRTAAQRFFPIIPPSTPPTPASAAGWPSSCRR